MPTGNTLGNAGQRIVIRGYSAIVPNKMKGSAGRFIVRVPCQLWTEKDGQKEWGRKVVGQWGPAPVPMPGQVVESRPVVTLVAPGEARHHLRRPVVRDLGLPCGGAGGDRSRPTGPGAGRGGPAAVRQGRHVERAPRPATPPPCDGRRARLIISLDRVSPATAYVRGRRRSRRRLRN